MLRSILRALGGDGASATPSPAPDLIDLGDCVRHALVLSEGVVHIDWDIAMPCVERQADDPHTRWAAVRSVVRAWMDTVGRSLTPAHAGFRTAGFEGLAPSSQRARVHGACERASSVVLRALSPIRGTDPPVPLGVVAVATLEQYMTITAHFHPPEGEWATSGGIYISHCPEVVLPLVFLPAGHAGMETTIAHEFTHHALAELRLPLWAEEGLTQMMEERVTGECRFVVTQDILRRHRARWESDGLAAFWTGESFSSPHEDTAELSYHLAQLLVRSLLDQAPKSFFAFARAATRQDDGFAAAREHLGLTELDELAWRTLRPRR